MNRLTAILNLRCSHCREGRVFRAFLRMNENCPHCGSHFEREQGYWMMSVFVGYVIYFAILGPISLILYFQQATLSTILLIDGILIALLAIPIFIYSRVIWLHIDELLDPRVVDS
jgi:uncharacterized protein (DUF983 family)